MEKTKLFPSSPSPSPRKKKKTLPLWNLYSKTQTLSHFVAGLRDSLNLSQTIEYFVKSRRLQKLFFKSCVQNGLIFLGSVFLLRFVFPVLFSLVGADGWFSEGTNSVIRVLADLFMLYPLYALSSFKNSKIYDEISSYSYDLKFRRSDKKKRPQLGTTNEKNDDELRSEDFEGLRHSTFVGRRKVKKKGVLNFRGTGFQAINDLIMEQIILFLFFVISSILAKMNFKWIIIGKLFSFFTTSWLYSYNSFNIVWKNEPEMMTYDVKLKYFERHCIYFLGYGAIYSISTLIFPFFINYGLFALLTPLEIIKALNCKVKEIGKTKIPNIKIFFVPRIVNRFLGRMIFKFFKMEQGSGRTTTADAKDTKEKKSEKVVKEKTE